MTTALAHYEIAEDARLGPAMEALTDKQRQFVLALLQTGCSNAKAAQLAGYAGNSDVLKSMGWRLSHDARIQAAIHEEAEKLIRTTAPMAIGVMTAIAQDPAVDPKDRLKAAVELLNRSGLHAHTEHKITVERQSKTAAELIKEIQAMAGDLGLDASKLLYGAGVVDADFQVIEAPADASADAWTVEPAEASHDKQ
jgi:phage terminase small subunit